MLAVAAVIVVVLMGIGIHSCQVSSRNSAMKDYNNSVASLIQQSDNTGRQLFAELSSGTGSTNAQQLRHEILLTLDSANKELSAARSLSVPDQMSTAQRDFVRALTMRRDGIYGIANNIEQAFSSSTPKDAINNIALGMADFYASDVVYKQYAAKEIAAALNAAGIGAGQTIAGGQFLPSIDWLNPTSISKTLGSKAPASTSTSTSTRIAPGTHGHWLHSVSVAGTTLQTGSTNAIPASPAPTFTLTLSNTGQNTETNVKCKVTVSGTSDSGTTVIPQTTSGEQTTCNVTLSSSPPTGQYTVSATVEPVPGEKNTVRNTLTFPVAFQ